MNILHVTAMTWKSNEDHFLLFLPLFFGYLLGSCLNLRVWLASQKVPAVVKQEEPKDANVESDNFMKDILFVTSIILFPLAVSIFWEPFRFVILTCIATHYVQPVAVCLVFFGFQLSFRHTRYGGLSVRFRHEDDALTYKRLFPVLTLLSLGFQFAVIWFHSNIGMSVMLGMALCARGISDSSKRSSISSIFDKVITTGEVILLFYKVNPFIGSLFAAQNDRKAESHNIAESDIFPDWIYITFATLPLVSLFSLFLRFDFANHIASVEATQGSPVDTVLAEVTAPEATSLGPDQPTASAVVPFRIPPVFKPPYFISAFLGWLLANFAVVQLAKRGLLFNSAPFVSGLSAHALGLLYIAPFLMILSAIIVSMLRGEMGRLRRFEGQCDLKPMNAVSENEKVGMLVDVTAKETT